MRVTIQPSQIKGKINAPASKSSMQRACAAALLINGETTIINPGHSNDDKAAIEIIKALGAEVEIGSEVIKVKSSGFPITNFQSPLTINCSESGLSIRMFTPLVALSNKEINIIGSGSLATRPMNIFDEVFPKLGVKIITNEGKLPIMVQGPLRPANIEIDGSLSSQFLTGLLMAYGSFFLNTSVKERVGLENYSVTIKVRNLKSKPYIDLTLDVMRKFGLRIPENKNYEEFIFSNDVATHHSSLPLLQYTVEGDWSGGAFLLVAGAIAGPITVRGLDLTSTQADKAIVDALMSANAGIAMDAKGIVIHPSKMNGFYFDATDCPDLFPPLVSLAAYCSGETKIKGVCRLTFKESNRALTLQEEFGKMGVIIEFDDDIMIIHGSEKVKGAKVHSHHDHRIAMACSVTALKAEGDTIIEEAGAVKKSYPDFYNDLKKLGADVSLPYQHFNL